MIPIESTGIYICISERSRWPVGEVKAITGQHMVADEDGMLTGAL